MRNSLKIKIGAGVTTLALAGTLAVVASGTTGAYFSDTQSGGITGTVGSIHVSVSGQSSDGSNGDGINLLFKNLMPGTAQTVTFNFKNTGPVAQDVFLTFPNVPALHALNNLGTYGEVHVVDNGGTHLFDSANLNDGRTRADGTNSCGALTPAGCWPLPASLKVASNLAPGANGAVSFSFGYAGKLGNPSNGHPGSNGGTGGVWNSYPVTDAYNTDKTTTPGAGLPVNVVATQVGQQPG